MHWNEIFRASKRKFFLLVREWFPAIHAPNSTCCWAVWKAFHFYWSTVFIAAYFYFYSICFTFSGEPCITNSLYSFCPPVQFKPNIIQCHFKWTTLLWHKSMLWQVFMSNFHWFCFIDGINETLIFSHFFLSDDLSLASFTLIVVQQSYKS